MADVEKDLQDGTQEEEITAVEEPSIEEADKVDTDESEKETDFDTVEPEVRKQPIDYINERRANRTAEREPSNNRREESVESDEPDNETLSPAAQRLIEQEVSKRLGPALKVVSSGINDREVDDIASQNPNWKKYAPLVRKYRGQDGWDGVPTKRIFQMVDYEYAEKRGAQTERERKSSHGASSGGTSYRPTERRGGNKVSAEEVAKLNPDQYKALQSRLAQGESIQT